MFDYKHYVPILLWKRGEQIGLQHCTENVKDRMTPLLEIPPIDWNYTTDVPKKTPDEHVAGIAESIVRSWGTERPFFLDTYNLDDETDKHGRPICERIYKDCREHSLQAIPVLSLQTPPSELASIEATIKADHRGVCLRFTPQDLENEDVFRRWVEERLNEFGLSNEEVDLLFDLGYTPERPSLVHIRALINDVLFEHSSWRTFTVASTSFPVDLSDVERDSIEALLRIEWETWEKLLSAYQSRRIPRMPTFGDYAINNPTPLAIDPRRTNPSGQIRYTIENEFIIVKGGAVRDTKRGQEVVARGRTYKQMRGLCQALVSRDDFRGRDFSWGDRYILDCANGQVSTGNAETWRRVGTNHHLTFVVEQLANYPWPEES